MSVAEERFKKLLSHVEVAAKFDYAASLLSWDQHTKMPAGGSAGRAEVYGTVKTEAFKCFTSDEVETLLNAVERSIGDLALPKQQLVNRIRGIYERSKAIPPSLFQSFSEAQAKAYPIWVKAKEQSDFKSFQPVLEEIVEFRRKFAEQYGYEKNPYDGLLPDYEPGLTAEDLRKIIDPLRRALVPLVQSVVEEEKPDDTILRGHFPEEAQHKISHEVLKTIGYDFNRGRLDTTEHPFTTSVGPDDVRVTTNFKVGELSPALFATIHEGGHALYDLGKDPLVNWLYLDTGYSLGLHESQSRMWENMVGRSLSFWKFFYPKLQATLPYYKKISLKDFYRAINTVKPSLIRIYADELTYNLHIILRFEIEEALLNNRIQVRELPGVWNDKVHEYLGIRPSNDAEGVLQDVHWSQGYIGYFPTYMLGTLYAAQLFETAKKEVADLDGEIAKGNLKALLDWLKIKVHSFGLIREAPELLKEVTGKVPTSKPWLQYVRAKYATLYNLS